MSNKAIISIIVAVSDNGVIGKDNTLPWHLSADLRYFKKQTVGKPIIMGRKTWESIGKALPDRHNIVVSRNKDFKAAGATVATSLATAIEAAGDAVEIMVIGGEAIYAEALPLANRIYLTRVHLNVDNGDAKFPAIDPKQWKLRCENYLASEDGQPACTFTQWIRA